MIFFLSEVVSEIFFSKFSQVLLCIHPTEIHSWVKMLKKREIMKANVFFVKLFSMNKLKHMPNLVFGINLTQVKFEDKLLK